MIGETLQHYRILRRLGSGGMGEVYLAEDTKLEREVALKVLPAGVAGDPERCRRFETEARAVAALNHPNIVTIYSIEEMEDTCFLTMERIEGRPLSAVITSDGLTRTEFYELVLPILDAVCAAHQKGIIHRDLKPDNIMVTDDGRVKVLDFGLAKLRDEPVDADTEDQPTQTLDGRLFGTVPYMAPEQLQGLSADHRSDVFSLGVIQYELLAGRRPFAGENSAELISCILRDAPRPLTELDPLLPRHLDHLIRRCLEKDPERRLQSALDLRNELEELQRAGSAAAEAASRSIAVLPFADMSPDKDQDYFCEGMAEEIINSLTQVEGLRVASRMSAFQFKAAAGDSREIGRKLGVDTLLTGSVRKAGQRLRITAQMVNAADGYDLWSQRYDRQLEDVFAVQDEIAQSIAQALQVSLGTGATPGTSKAPTRNVEAYEYYLRGRQFFYRMRKADLEFALQMFGRASEIDPEFARAFAGIADCWSFKYFTWVDGSKDAVDNAIVASRKALELDPALAEAHAAHGMALALSQQYDEAEAAFETALSLDPNQFEALYHYGRACFAQGKLEQAAQLFERTSAVHPDTFEATTLLPQIYEGLGRPDEAMGARRRGLRRAERRLELNPDDTRARYLLSNLLIGLGEREKGLQWARDAMAVDPEEPVVLYNSACAFCLAGEFEQSLDILEKAVRVGNPHRYWIEYDSDLDPLRDHPRFKALLEQFD